MAGKEDTKQSSMEKESETAECCWRKQVDLNLKRLHSLLFGADLALDKRDFSSAQLLSLRLIGFLDSRSQNDVDLAFIRPIRREALSKLDTARRSLVPESDRQAFEQAGSGPGFVFSKQEDIDIEKIKKSKYFQVLLQHSKGKSSSELGDQLECEDNLSSKTSKVMTQTKLTSLYGNISRANNKACKSFATSKGNSSDDFIVVEKAPSYHIHSKNRGTSTFINVEEEEKAHGGSVGSKRAHVEIRSPRNEVALSPSSNEEANTDVSGNGFVSARTKLEMDARQRRGMAGSQSPCVSPQSDNNGMNRGYGARSYGYSRRGIRGNFVPPIKSKESNVGNVTSRSGGKGDDALDDSTKRWLVE